jgi:hypothetical protein
MGSFPVEICMSRHVRPSAAGDRLRMRLRTPDDGDRLPRGISVIVIAALAVLAWAALIAIVILVLNLI